MTVSSVPSVVTTFSAASAFSMVESPNLLRSIIHKIDTSIEEYCENLFVPIDGKNEFIYTPPDLNDATIKSLIRQRNKFIIQLRELNLSPFDSKFKKLEMEKENETRLIIADEIKNEFADAKDFAITEEIDNIILAITSKNYDFIRKNPETHKPIIDIIIEKMQNHKKNKIVKKVLGELRSPKTP
jgi:hypothetical protein